MESIKKCLKKHQDLKSLKACVFVCVKFTARHAMARSTGQKATVMAREQGHSAWTRENLWVLHMKSE